MKARFVDCDFTLEITNGYRVVTVCKAMFNNRNYDTELKCTTEIELLFQLVAI